uniref:Fucolectin tachylectin-4 pentraxin-1 domain-containing protein n=1 Tax=Branchiostoma floridae TaxID=7739 RepID=C3XXD6_BRAFL|eukprot:XP_002611386.1 hypothetical protein BRAFLDRAFT_73217 [Branchiostoma floridae]
MDAITSTLCLSLFFMAAGATGVNVALGKTAFQTSNYQDGAASRAVDGNTATNWLDGSCTHTRDSGEDNPTWWVDLGQSYGIDRLVIFNRRDCCAERLNPFNIHIGDSDQVSMNPKCGGDHHINVTQPSISVSCQGMEGRYVGIRLPGYSRTLTLCEVQVFSEGETGKSTGTWYNKPLNLTLVCLGCAAGIIAMGYYGYRRKHQRQQQVDPQD